jgi:hypothetical protein
MRRIVEDSKELRAVHIALVLLGLGAVMAFGGLVGWYFAGSNPGPFLVSFGIGLAIILLLNVMPDILDR